MIYFLLSIFGYLLGSIPFALVIGKLFYGTDVRNSGSGNLGATNTGRVLGKNAGVIVALLDVFKAFLAMLIVYPFYPDLVLIPGFFATIGHIYPVFAGFKGGKAVSTSFGLLLGISIFMKQNFLLVFGLPLLSFFIILYLSKIVSLSSMISVTIASIVLWWQLGYDAASIAYSIINAIVIIRHHENIVRIIQGKENKISWI